MDCGEEILGRSDKKFCGDPCRNAYHNRLYARDTGYVREVNRILSHNRRTLSKLLGLRSRIRTAREDLLRQGFRFGYFTRLDTQQGEMSYRCYEFGLRETQPGNYLLWRADI